MLLLWWLSMVQVISLSSWWKKFFILLVLSIILFVSVVAEFCLNCEKFSISPLQAYPFRCWFFQQPRYNPSWKGAFQAHLWQKLSFSSPSLYPNNLASILSFWRHCDVALFTHHLELWGPCSFRAYPFNRSVMSSFQVLPILSSFASLFYRSAACILSFSFLAYSVSTRVVTWPSLSLELFIHVFATPRFS